MSGWRHTTEDTSDLRAADIAVTMETIRLAALATDEAAP